MGQFVFKGYFSKKHFEFSAKNINEMVGKIMVNRFKTLLMGMLIVASVGTTFGQTIDFVIEDLTVDPGALVAASCLQIPLLINDNLTGGRELKDLTFTVEISGDTGIISGGITADMLVANAFGAGATFTGITNPGSDLMNVNSTPTPACTSIFNQATEGSGPAINFAMGAANGTWFINNNGGGVGRKSGFVINFGGLTIHDTVQGQDTLIGVLEIPIMASPGPSQLMVTATSNGVVADANIYTFDDGTDEDGNRALVQEDLGLANAVGIINIFQPEDCAGATVADTQGAGNGANIQINYLDPMAGGVGGEVTFTMPHSANVDQITITGTDGFNTTIPATGTQTMLTINTQGDGSPAVSSSSVTYSIVYEIEFPPMSGTFVAGMACPVTVSWAPTTCTVVCDPQPPVFGNPVAIDVTMTNAVWDAVNSRFGVLTSDAVNWPGDIDLTAPTVVGNTLTFDDAYTIAAAGANDIGTYSTSSTGPGVGNTSNCSHLLVLGAPENNIVCATDITSPVMIGGTATIQLNGNNVVTWRIDYGAFNDTVPGTDTTYDLMPILGNVTSVTITAEGFDTMGNPDSDPVTCVLDFADPVCLATTQNPDSTVTPVDVGTPITLTLVTTGAVSATIDGAPMAVTSGVVNMDNQITWEATHVAVIDTVITAVITNPDGTTQQCTWIIDINCVDPEIISVAPVGQTGITISGTDGCAYDVSIIDSTGFCVVISIPVGASGTGTNTTQVIPPDATIQVGQQGAGCGGIVSDQIRTVPTLGEWAMIAFVMLLMATGVVIMRRRRRLA
jgi:hypothetical protein